MTTIDKMMIIAPNVIIQAFIPFLVIYIFVAIVWNEPLTKFVMINSSKLNPNTTIVADKRDGSNVLKMMLKKVFIFEYPKS